MEREGAQTAPETTNVEVVGGPWEGARHLQAALPLRVGGRPASRPGLGDLLTMFQAPYSLFSLKGPPGATVFCLQSAHSLCLFLEKSTPHSLVSPAPS